VAFLKEQAMMSANVSFPSKANDASDVENSPRSTSAGGASTPSTASLTPPPSPTGSRGRDQLSENVASDHEDRDRQFEALDAELADCEGEASIPLAGLSSSRAGIPKTPEYAPFVVRNTFLDELIRPMSLDGFFSERHVHSCPATRQHTANDDPLGALAAWGHDGGSSSDEEETHEFFNTGSPRYNHESLETIYIRNTFINALVSRSESLEAFLQERKVQSCPNTERAPRMASTEQSAQNDVVTRGPSLDDEVLPPMPLPVGWIDFLQQVASAAQVIPAPPPPPAEWVSAARTRLRALGEQVMAEEAPGAVGAEMRGIPPPPPAEWAPTAFDFGVAKPPPLPTGELGSPEMPSLGSLLHSSGQCQPCGFFHTKGCGNGARCTFCHLCSSGVVKRRRREKREQFREAREAASLAAEKEVENLDIVENLTEVGTQN